MSDKETTIYDFKTNFSRYIAALEAGKYDKIIVKRRNTPVGEFTLKSPEPSKKKIPWGIWKGKMTSEELDAAFNPEFEAEIAEEFYKNNEDFD